MRALIVRGLVITLAVSVAGVPAAFARAAPVGQSRSSPPPDERARAAVRPEANLDRIRRALGRDRSLRLDGVHRRFYLQVVARTPTVYRFPASKDLFYGPVPRAQMTHQEYVRMMTPKEMYSGVGIRPHEVIEWAITSFLTKAVISGLRRLAEASTESERIRIQSQIDRELEAIERAKRKNKR